MADEQKSLEFLLTTKAELGGAMQLSESLERQIGQAKAMGKDYSGLDAQLKTVNSTISKSVEGNEELRKEQKRLGETAEFVHQNHRKLDAIFRSMGEGTVPTLLTSFMALFKGPLGPALALIAIVEKVKSKLEETNAELDKMAEEASKPMGAGMADYRKSLDETRVELGKFLAELKHAGEDTDPIKTQIDRTKERVEAELEGQKKIIEAYGKTEVARLHAQGASPERIAAAEQRTQVALDALNMASQRTRGSSSLMSELDAREKAAPKLEAAAQAKRIAADTAKYNLGSDQAAIEVLRNQLGLAGKGDATYTSEMEKLSELTAEIDRRRKRRDAAMKNPETAWVAIQEEKDIAGAQAKISGINQARELRRERLGQLESGLEGKAASAANAEADAAAADSQAKTNRGRLRQIPGELDQAGKVENINERTDRTVEVMNAHGGKMNDSLATVAQKAGYTAEQTKQLAEKIAMGITGIGTAFAVLEARVAAVNARLSRVESNTNLH